MKVKISPLAALDEEQTATRDKGQRISGFLSERRIRTCRIMRENCCGREGKKLITLLLAANEKVEPKYSNREQSMTGGRSVNVTFVDCVKNR